MSNVRSRWKSEQLCADGWPIERDELLALLRFTATARESSDKTCATQTMAGLGFSYDAYQYVDVEIIIPPVAAASSCTFKTPIGHRTYH